MIRVVSLAVVLLALAWEPAMAQGVVPGIYGNVTSSEETDDLGGAELELIGTGGDARVEFVICEGWCNAIRTSPVSFTADGFTFSYVEDYADQDGNPLRSRKFDAVVARKGAGVTLTITPADSDWFFGYVLRPIDERFGLDVAAEE